MIAQKHNVGEARLPQAAGGGGERALEGRLGNRDRAGKAHVLGGRRDVALRHVGQHRRDQRVAQLRGDPASQDLRPGIMLAERDMRPALLGAAHRDDDGRDAGLQRGAELGPGQVF